MWLSTVVREDMIMIMITCNLVTLILPKKVNIEITYETD